MLAGGVESGVVRKNMAPPSGVFFLAVFLGEWGAPSGGFKFRAFLVFFVISRTLVSFFFWRFFGPHLLFCRSRWSFFLPHFTKLPDRDPKGDLLRRLLCFFFSRQAFER